MMLLRRRAGCVGVELRGHDWERTFWYGAMWRVGVKAEMKVSGGRQHWWSAPLALALARAFVPRVVGSRVED